MHYLSARQFFQSSVCSKRNESAQACLTLFRCSTVDFVTVLYGISVSSGNFMCETSLSWVISLAVTPGQSKIFLLIKILQSYILYFAG